MLISYFAYLFMGVIIAKQIFCQVQYLLFTNMIFVYTRIGFNAFKKIQFSYSFRSEPSNLKCVAEIDYSSFITAPI
jgi:hypothetical protein